MSVPLSQESVAIGQLMFGKYKTTFDCLSLGSRFEQCGVQLLESRVVVRFRVGSGERRVEVNINHNHSMYTYVEVYLRTTNYHIRDSVGDSFGEPTHHELASSDRLHIYIVTIWMKSDVRLINHLQAMYV